MSWAHLAKRFATSLWPGGPPNSDEVWVASILSSREQVLWERMSGADRRHAVGVARRVEVALGDEATTPILAAALLHDVGKVASGLGTYGRVVATLAGKVAGPQMAPAWSKGGGITRRTGLYLRHGELGAEMLEVAGADPLTSTWAREHHHPEADWSLPLHVASALKAADDD
ncbi:MAG: hypothetical protein QOG03_1437 [Actinomycetota bacterium]|nr:hypothetical protein [Actinomycetota bacterium]